MSYSRWGCPALNIGGNIGEDLIRLAYHDVVGKAKKGFGFTAC